MQKPLSSGTEEKDMETEAKDMETEEKTKDGDTRVGKDAIQNKFKWLWSVGAKKLK